MIPKCGFCDNTLFRVTTPLVGPTGARYKMPYVVCNKCNAVIAVLSQYDPGVTAKAAEDKIDELQKRLNYLEAAVNNIDTNLVRLGQAISRLSK